jgi:Holliday junction resolvase RusA-like endonuclease
MKLNEYKELVAKNKRKASPLLPNDTKAEILQQTMAALQHLQNDCGYNIPLGDVKLSLKLKGKSQADDDNIFKGVADALQGYAYKNDKQVRLFDRE